jgi:hypothetical protein
MIGIFWGAGHYAFHIGIGDSLNVIVFVSNGVVVRGVVILLNFAFEGTMCREEFANILAYPAQSLLSVCRISVPQDLGGSL